MNFREKKPLHAALKGVQYLEADKALLSTKDPENKTLSLKKKPEALQADILYTLLDFATRDEIVNNRRGTIKEEAQIHEVETLIAELKEADNEVAAKALFANITDLLATVPEPHRESLSAAALEAVPTTEKLKDAEYNEAIIYLNGMDFDKPKEIEIELIDKLVKFFDVQVKGKKKENKLKALQTLRETMHPATNTEQPATCNQQPATGSEQPASETTDSDKKKE